MWLLKICPNSSDLISGLYKLHPTILVAVDVEGGFGFGATFIWPACGSYNLGPEHDEKG